jgi:hypothetical protein
MSGEPAVVIRAIAQDHGQGVRVTQQAQPETLQSGEETPTLPADEGSESFFGGGGSQGMNSWPGSHGIHGETSYSLHRILVSIGIRKRIPIKIARYCLSTTCEKAIGTEKPRGRER